MISSNPPYPITITNLADNTAGLVLKTNKSTGLITGTFLNPSNPSQTIKVSGVVVEGQTNAQGYFLGSTNGSGVFSVSLQ